jgi:hypothetical protein
LGEVFRKQDFIESDPHFAEIDVAHLAFPVNICADCHFIFTELKIPGDQAQWQSGRGAQSGTPNQMPVVHVQELGAGRELGRRRISSSAWDTLARSSVFCPFHESVNRLPEIFRTGKTGGLVPSVFDSISRHRSSCT